MLCNLRNRRVRLPHSRIPIMSPETASAVSHRAAQLENALRKVIRGKDESFGWRLFP